MKRFIVALLILAGCTVPAPTELPETLTPSPTTVLPTETRVYPTYTVEIFTVTPVLPSLTPTPDVPIGVIYAGPLCKDYVSDNTTATATIDMTACLTRGIKYLQYDYGLVRVQ